MSENTERPVAVWRKRNDALRTMECSNCKADAHYQIVDGVWGYEPYCAHCGSRVYKQEDLPMSENKKPRLAEVLGVEVEEEFNIDGEFCNPFYVNEEGCLLDSTGYRRSNKAVKIINNPDLIKRRPRWAEQEVQDAKNIIRMFGEDRYPYVIKTMDGLPYLSDDLESLAMYTINLEPEIFPSLKCGETVKITDIIGGDI